MYSPTKQKIIDEIATNIDRINREIQLCEEHELILAYQMLYDKKIDLQKQLNFFYDWLN